MEHGNPTDTLRRELALPPFHAVLRPEAVRADASAGEIEIRLPFRPEFRRLPDRDEYHGGVISMLADVAGHAAVAVRLGHSVPTINIRVDFLSQPRVGSALIAVARIMRLGRSLAVVDIELTDDTGQRVALGRGTYGTR